METLQFEAKKTESGLMKVDSSGLDAVVKNSGLPAQEANEIKSSYLPFLNQLSETQTQAVKINFENPSELDENIARELRLRTVKIRTAAEKMKDERKRMYLLRGNLEQASYNLIATSCKLIEELFFNVEKAREIAEKKRKEQLRADRMEKLSPYTEDVALYPLGEMSEEQFSSLYATLRAAHERRIEEERKAEEDRIAKEKADADEKERQRLENIRLKEEADKREKEIAAEREKQRKENEERERLAEIERKKQADLLAQERAKAEAERKERERLAEEIRLKEDADRKANADAERKQKEAEKKARLAPDKDKLIAFAKTIDDLPRPEIKAIEAANIIANANTLLCKVRDYINENAAKL